MSWIGAGITGPSDGGTPLAGGDAVTAVEPGAGCGAMGAPPRVTQVAPAGAAEAEGTITN